MIVRPRREADLDRCAEALLLVHRSDSYPLNWPADPRAWLAPATAAWVAEAADGTIAGHVAVRESGDVAVRESGDVAVRESGDGAVRESGDGAELCRLFVVPTARRRGGVGRALVEQARAWAAERDRRLTLNVVDEQRSAAIAFYEATGWRLTHFSLAGWAGKDGRPVRLRHYEAG